MLLCAGVRQPVDAFGGGVRDGIESLILDALRIDSILLHEKTCRGRTSLPHEITPAVWEPFMELLSRHRRFLISSHINPDGDAIGSAVAFKRILEKLGKEVLWVMDEDPGEMFYSFYRKEELQVLNSSNSRFEDWEVMVMVDASVWKRLGKTGSLMAEHAGVKLNIDHHRTEEIFPGVKFHDITSPSTTVIVYRILKKLGLELTRDLAEPIYLGMIVDTQNFHLPNTTIEAHQIASECMRAGVEPNRVYEPVFGTLRFSRMKLMSDAFGTVQIHFGGIVGVMYTTSKMFEDAGAMKNDDEGFSDMVRTIEGVRVGIYLREDADGTVKVSWRSKGDNNIEISARRFGGGGHMRASGALMRGNLKDVLRHVLDDLGERIAKGEIQ
jgi:phosphoesterase RecJ-like protein